MFPDSTKQLVTRLAHALSASHRSIAVAESLTCGRLIHAIGAGEEASEWLRGGIVAYQTDVKQDVLGVRPGPVVSAACAEDLASGAARMFGATVAVSATGVGGPGPEEGGPAGTVYLGRYVDGRVGSELHRFEGDADAVLDRTTEAALEAILRELEAAQR